MTKFLYGSDEKFIWCYYRVWFPSVIWKFNDKFRMTLKYCLQVAKEDFMWWKVYPTEEINEIVLYSLTIKSSFVGVFETNWVRRNFPHMLFYCPLAHLLQEILETSSCFHFYYSEPVEPDVKLEFWSPVQLKVAGSNLYFNNRSFAI